MARYARRRRAAIRRGVPVRMGQPAVRVVQQPARPRANWKRGPGGESASAPLPIPLARGAADRGHAARRPDDARGHLLGRSAARGQRHDAASAGLAGTAALLRAHPAAACRRPRKANSARRTGTRCLPRPGLDPSKFQPAEPLWTSLAASDTRKAWTRNSPRAQRVEAASLRGQPVFFTIVEPWTKPDRTPGASDSTHGDGDVQRARRGAGCHLIVAAALLAAGNLRRQRGDRRGALRLAAFVFCVQMALWAARAHIIVSFGTFGTFLVALGDRRRFTAW